METLDLRRIRCVVFDFGFTLSSDHYFRTGPDGCPEWCEVIQRHVFGSQPVVEAWMRGDLRLADIAAIVGHHVDLPQREIVAAMERGCVEIGFNPAVWGFACAQRAQGRKTALVTANMDIFTSIIVPAFQLDHVFDVILNTADCGHLRKELLWDRAFAQLGEGIGYRSSLLIEDGEREPALFRERGGVAHQYEGESAFQRWLGELGWRP